MSDGAPSVMSTMARGRRARPTRQRVAWRSAAPMRSGYGSRGCPGCAGCAPSSGVPKSSSRRYYPARGVGGKAVDGDAVVPGLGGTRQQQRCLLLDGQQGLRAADSHVAGGRRQVEQHQHAAARRLDAGAHEQPPIGCQRRRRSTRIDGGVEIEVITFPLPAQALVAAQTTPAAPGVAGSAAGGKP